MDVVPGVERLRCAAAERGGDECAFRSYQRGIVFLAPQHKQRWSLDGLRQGYQLVA